VVRVGRGSGVDTRCGVDPAGVDNERWADVASPAWLNAQEHRDRREYLDVVMPDARLVALPRAIRIDPPLILAQLPHLRD
jgi:hypothetical protein